MNVSVSRWPQTSKTLTQARELARRATSAVADLDPHLRVSRLGSDPGMACEVYVSAPPASSMTVTAGQRAQEKAPGGRTREVMLDPGASANTPGQKPRARPEPAWTGRRPSPARCRRAINVQLA